MTSGSGETSARDWPANLLVNADDFGIHPRVSLAIAQCLDEGLIHSFSVLPFHDAFHGELLRNILARHPEAKVGVHLSVLSAGTGLEENPFHFREFLGGYLTGRYPLRGIRGTWEAQVRSLGGYLGGTDRIAHMDGHQHLHMLPGLWSAARDLQERYRIPRLRVPYEGLARSAWHRFPYGLALQALARIRRGHDPRSFIGFRTSTAFTLAGNLHHLEAVLMHPERGYELMVHPALPGDEGPNAGAPALSQEAEIQELRKARDYLLGRRSPGT